MNDVKFALVLLLASWAAQGCRGGSNDPVPDDSTELDCADACAKPGTPCQEEPFQDDCTAECIATITSDPSVDPGCILRSITWQAGALVCDGHQMASVDQCRDGGTSDAGN